MREESQRLIRSFGRIKSRKLSAHKKSLLEKPLKDYSINLPITLQQRPTYLEIGFGFGDFLFEKAKKNSEKIFFGCEPHLNGVVNLLAKMEDAPLKNLQISTQDVRPSLEKFPDKFFDEIFILFPEKLET